MKIQTTVKGMFLTASTKNSIIIKFIIALSFVSCEQFVEVDPPQTSLTGSTVFINDATATAAVIGIYARMSESSDRFQSGTSSVTLMTGLSSDEFNNISTDPRQTEFYMSSLLEDNNYVSKMWSDLYEDIYSANAVLEGLSNSQGLTTAVKQQLEGEVRFIRAFSYFYMVNLFGNVPLVTDTDYKKNSLVPPAAESDVYSLIISDLKESQILLSDNYVNSERTRPNKMTATALLSRVYLYTEEWAKAETEATSVINNAALYEMGNDLNGIFLKDSKETIWQLQPVVSGYATFDGYSFIFDGYKRNVSLSSEIMDAFEIDDNRKTAWVASETISAEEFNYVYKYKTRLLASSSDPSPEYLIVFRLAEQHLIRAEARTNQENFSGAQADLNIVRNRAGLTNTDAVDKATLLEAIEQENRIEFFAEWGHRWLDLKRTNRANAVLGSLKGSSWQETDLLYPYPQSEMILNPNLKPQNSGY